MMHSDLNLKQLYYGISSVLILVLMDDALWLGFSWVATNPTRVVLILVLMDDALWRYVDGLNSEDE